MAAAVSDLCSEISPIFNAVAYAHCFGWRLDVWEVLRVQ